MDELMTQVVESLAARSTFYRTLASLYFNEITAAQIDAMAKQDFAGLDGGNALIAEGYGDIVRYLKKRNSGTRQQIAADFAHSILAAGSYEARMATPYESVFTSANGLLMQEARDDVYRMFCDEKIGVRKKLQMPDDHLSFEFEFMAHLSDRAGEAVACADYATANEALATQQEFYEHHLLSWIDEYCDVLENVAQTRFYRGVSKITRGFVKGDAEFISDLYDAVGELASSVCAGAK